jgi:hypothetical protein
LVEHRFWFQRLFTFELHSCSFKEGYDHLADALLHLGADSAFADEYRKPVQVFGVFAA